MVELIRLNVLRGVMWMIYYSMCWMILSSDLVKMRKGLVFLLVLSVVMLMIVVMMMIWRMLKLMLELNVFLMVFGLVLIVRLRKFCGMRLRRKFYYVLMVYGLLVLRFLFVWLFGWIMRLRLMLMIMVMNVVIVNYRIVWLVRCVVFCMWWRLEMFVMMVVKISGMMVVCSSVMYELLIVFRVVDRLFGFLVVVLS